MAIKEAFGIPDYHSTIYETKEETLSIFDAKPKSCSEVINKQWLQKPRAHYTKMPKRLFRTNFKEEYGDLILLLNRVAGSPQASPFEPCMFYFIDEVTFDVKMIIWAKIISNSIDEQLRNMEHTKSIYMSSYIIYMLARCYRYKGLICKGVVGNKDGQFKAYDCYLQLHLQEKS